MGNCSGIHSNVYPKASIIQIQDPLKLVQPKPWKMVSMLSQKTQPSLFDYDDHDLIKHKVNLDKNGKLIGTSKELELMASVT